MATIRTLTREQLIALENAVALYAHYFRSDHDMAEERSADALEYIQYMGDAVNVARVDRERLRAALEYIAESPCDPDISPKQHAAWLKLQAANRKAERLRARIKNRRTSP